MRRRTKKQRCMKEEYTPEIDNQFDEDVYATKQKTKRHINQSKTKSSNPQTSSIDDSNSQILQIRNGDQEVREHIRPSFMKRWDGVSNDLQLTEDELDQLSPMMRIYWQTKSKNMNAIIFLQFGKMQFFAFQNDAIKLNQLTKKKLKKFSKFLMVNFWCKQIEDVKKRLFEMKIPVLIMNEIQDANYKQIKGLIRRQIVEVITPALHLQQEDETPRSRLLLSVYHNKNKCAVLILDAQSNNFFMQEFQDDMQFHEIRRIFNKYHPVQLIIPNKGHRQISQIARQICNPYINQIELNQISLQHQLNLFKTYNPSQFFRQLHQSHLKEIYKFQYSYPEKYSSFRIIQAISLIWRYLQSISLLQKVFYQGIFHDFNSKSSTVNFFDSQVYQNLEVFRIKSSQQETYAQLGTLMGFLDHCKTKHGRKMLHRWIDQPLTNIEAINQRQEAVQQLIQNPQLLDVHNQLLKYERLQKKLGDIYHWVSRNYEKGKTILTKYINPQKQYDIRKNPAVNKLKQIVSILNQIKEYQAFLSKLSKINIKSRLLKKYIHLIQINNIHNFNNEQIEKIDGIPQISYIADTIFRRLDYNQLTGHLQPAPGQNQVFDEQKKQMMRINQELQIHLNKWKQYFQTQKIAFVSVRAKNQIQVPKMAIKKSSTNKDLIFSSQIANFVRYTTIDTNILSQQIMEHQKAIAQSYEPFLQDIVEQFCRYKFLWNLHVRSMSNLDVLMSLAKAAGKMPVKCLPTFKQGLKIHTGYNANLLLIKEDLIPNSVNLTEKVKVLLLTGPNMGGKSTFLKQVCIFAILAQIGSYIPANQYSSIVYDQIFCRMGASDRIYQGKSTFYVQLQQTKRILSKATANSLVVIDELGRGTSTFDGMAIAEAILDYLLKQTKCTTLYSTHYTQITQKFKDLETVKLMKMGYETEPQGKIIFNYQLIDGVAERSFATNVGRMVGIPNSILQKAQIRSQKMQEQINRKKLMRQFGDIFLVIKNKK